MSTLSLPDTLEAVAASMRGKARAARSKTWILALLGGAYIALAAFGSTVAGCHLLAAPEGYGLGRLVTGLVFPIGLMLIVIGGGELFTGNCLMSVAGGRGGVSPAAMLRSLGLVYAGNFAGALAVTGLLAASGLFAGADGQIAAAAFRTARAKATLSGVEAFVLGVLCNWLVCLAVWLAARADEAAHKALLIFFPVCLFVLCGFEHSVANMYYLAAGAFVAVSPACLAAAGLPPDAAGLLPLTSLVHNLFFVTLGNAAGGALFVGGAYAAVYAGRSATQQRPFPSGRSGSRPEIRSAP